jgi:non-ribosomal peptide synthetase component E (peptide arylation enzyme)
MHPWKGTKEHVFSLKAHLSLGIVMLLQLQQHQQEEQQYNKQQHQTQQFVRDQVKDGKQKLMVGQQVLCMSGVRQVEVIAQGLE